MRLFLFLNLICSSNSVCALFNLRLGAGMEELVTMPFTTNMRNTMHKCSNSGELQVWAVKQVGSHNTQQLRLCAVLLKFQSHTLMFMTGQAEK